MNKKLLLLYISLAITPKCFAASFMDQETQIWFNELSSHITSKMSALNYTPSDGGKIEAYFDKTTGNLKRIKQLTPGKTLQAEANLIDATITESPICTDFPLTAILNHPIELGDSNLPNIPILKSKNRGELIKLQKIPLAVHDRYPNIFTREELLDRKNTFTVKVNRPITAQIKEIRHPWERFFKTHKTATREQILDLADRCFAGKKTNSPLINQ